MIRIILTLLLFSIACSSQTRKAGFDEDFSQMSSSEYHSLIKSFTLFDKQYEGFHNTFQVSATILNLKVIQANLNQLRYYMQWDAKRTREEREKKLQEMSAKSTFVVFLYTPEKEYNDLDKGKNSIWKIYLDHDGSRYIGKAKKNAQKFIQLKTIFPHITKFHKPYNINFDVPMSAIENDPTQLTLTSSLGSVTFKYNGLQRY